MMQPVGEPICVHGHCRNAIEKRNLSGQGFCSRHYRDAKYTLENQATDKENPAHSDLIREILSHKIEGVENMREFLGAYHDIINLERVEAKATNAALDLAAEIVRKQGDAMALAGKTIWLWQNGREFWAFDTLFPTHENGDPRVLGEPVGVLVNGVKATDNILELRAAIKEETKNG